MKTIKIKDGDVASAFVEIATKSVLNKYPRRDGIDPKCEVCGLERTGGTREATRDFVFANICIGCNIKRSKTQ